MNHQSIKKKSMLVLTALILISCVIVFKKFLFDGQILAYTDIGSDTASQYLMHYQTIIQHLRDGSFSLWDFHNGLGINMYSLNLFDPFLLILYAFGTLFGSEHIYGAMVYLQILRMLLAGLVVYGYLSCFRLSEGGKIVGGYLYALNGFLVVWGQHYQFGTIAVLFPLLLLMTELARGRKKWYLGVTVVCALVSMCSLYFGYMQLLALGFYVLFRTAWEDKLFSRLGIRRVGAMYGSMILGIGMGMFQLLPGARMIFGVSGRMGGESLPLRIVKAFAPYDMEYYKTLLLRFFSGNLQGINAFSGYQNYYEAPNVFLTFLFVIALVQYVYLIFWKNEKEKKQKILTGTALLAGMFLLLVPLGSLVFNGFAYPFSRHTFVLMPFLILMMVWTLDKMALEKKGNRVLLLLSTLLGCAVYGITFVRGPKKLSFLLAALAVLMAAALFVILRQSNQTEEKKPENKAHNRSIALVKRICMITFMLSVMGSAVLDAYVSYNVERNVLEAAPSEYMDALYDADLEEALAYLAETDPTFYRVEKDYQSGSSVDCLNALAQGYDGVSTYNSTLNSDTAEFFRQIWPNMLYINDDHFSFANAQMDTFQASLLNVKYVISRQEDFSAPGYVLLKEFGDLYVYKNQMTAEIAKFYTAAIRKSTFETEKTAIRQNWVLSKYLICDTVPELICDTLPEEAYQKENLLQEQNLDIVREAGTTRISFEAVSDENQVLILEFDLKHHQGGQIYAEAGVHKMHLYSEDPVHQVRMTLPENCSGVRIYDQMLQEAAVFSVENVKLYTEELPDLTELSSGISISNPKKDHLVTGTAEVSEPGILMIAIPYEAGWHAYVDGKEVDIHKVEYGLSGLFLEAGEHTIRMEYKCPGFTAGVTCSICFLLLTAAIWCGIVRKDKKRSFTLEDHPWQQVNG